MTATQTPSKKKASSSRTTRTKASESRSSFSRPLPGGIEYVGLPNLTRQERLDRRRDMEPFRELLVAKRRSLLKAYEVSRGETRDASSDGTEDYIDYAVNSYTREFSLSLTEMEQKQLRLVDEALRRIELGIYGFCLYTGEEIPRRRLEVEPWARYTIQVQELDDQGLLDESDLDDEDEFEDDLGDREDEDGDDDEDDEDDDEEEEEETSDRGASTTSASAEELEGDSDDDDDDD